MPTLICGQQYYFVNHTVTLRDSPLSSVREPARTERPPDKRSRELYVRAGGGGASFFILYRLFILVFLFSGIVISSCAQNDLSKNAPPGMVNGYKNPVVGYSLPDPTIIRAEDGKFYLYATEDTRNTPIHRSSDLVSWEFLGTAFSYQTRPSFEPKGGIWAPDINYINGQYVMYYSMSVWGGEWTCGIGVAVSDKPEGPFSDKGKLFRSNEIDVQNSIDPFYIEEQGKKFLFWGSFRGIYAVELAEDGLSVKTGAVKQKVAGTAYEGTYILKRGDYFHFFASIGTCCAGVNSTYTTVYGRSENLLGPYLNKSGQSLSDNRHEILIRGNDRFVGTGHNSEIVTDKEGKTWMLYHAVDKTNPKGRVLMLDEVKWENDWPFVTDQCPSREYPKPAF